MIIRSVTFEDFGVYGGRHTLDLAPRTEGTFDRPIVLFHGKNGVGKTSFVEGVRLALHGPLALGRRVSRRVYLDHLRRRIHRPADPDAERPESARVTVEFEFVRSGVPHLYTVTRHWRSTGIGLEEGVRVLEDGTPPPDVEADGLDAFLRELVPASAGDLFFFDGEKIDQLVDDAEADGVLADAVERLLGLHLVLQLDADLEVFITRTNDRLKKGETNGALAEAQAERDTLSTQVDALRKEQEENREALGGLQAAISRAEQDLATKGGAYAQRYETVKAEKAELEVLAESQRRGLREAAAGLLPFAAAPTLARRLLRRLDLESRYHQEQAAQALLDNRKERLVHRLLDDALWTQAGLSLPDANQRQHLAELLAPALDATLDERVSPNDVFVHASEHDRAAMTGQLREAIGPVAVAFHEAAAALAETETRLAQARDDLAMTPADLILQPIAETLQALTAEREHRQERDAELAKELGTAEFMLQRAENRIAKAKEALAQHEKVGGRVGLAMRAQEAVRAYASTLRVRKIRALEHELVRRFNELCRKSSKASGFLDHAHIDPKSFAISLSRGGETFERTELSAGEKQLFAVATLWALREVAELPMPVVVDTPLGRLDSDHRAAMVRTFLPQVAHQVILLATDTEVDADVEADLAPSVSHGYRMAFDPESGSTHLEAFEPEDLAAPHPVLAA